jgi:hypothetical protein
VLLLLLLLLLSLLLLLLLLLPHLCTMLAGTSQRFTPVGLTLTRSRLGVSGVTSYVSCWKLGPYCGAPSLVSSSWAV